MRNGDGTFKRGNRAAVGHGRPEGSGKNQFKDMCWDAINTVAHAVFGMPEAEMKIWYEANKGDLSCAERAYIEASQNNLAVIESLLDRIVGKTLKCDDITVSRDPIMEQYHRLGPEARKAEIDRLIENYRITERENESIRNGTV